MTFLVIVSLLFLSIPIGFGFALAVYLKREYAHLASAGDSSTAAESASEPPPGSENVMDILKSSGVAQDILSAEKPNEEANQTPGQENKSNEAPKEESAPLPQEQKAEPLPEPPVPPEPPIPPEPAVPPQPGAAPPDKPALEVPPENVVQNDEDNPLLHEKNGLVDEAIGTLEQPPMLHTEADALSVSELLQAASQASMQLGGNGGNGGNTAPKTSEGELNPTASEKIEPAETVEKPEAEELLGKDFDFDALKNALAESKEETVEKPEAEELLDKDFDFDALKNILAESKEEMVEKPEAEELLDKDFDFDALKSTLDEPKEETVEKSTEELHKEPIPKISKSTFENIPVYESVPEELLDTHLCVDQELLPDTVHSGGLEIRDSFVVVPESLLDRFEVDSSPDDSSPDARNFVQTQDAAIAISGRKK